MGGGVEWFDTIPQSVDLSHLQRRTKLAKLENAQEGFAKLHVPQ